jgi:hypothetical protein
MTDFAGQRDPHWHAACPSPVTNLKDSPRASIAAQELWADMSKSEMLREDRRELAHAT